VSIAGLWISGHSPRAGWTYGIASQAVWVAYGLTTHQHGLVALSAAMTIIYIRNLRRWRGTRFTPAASTTARKRDPGTAPTPRRVYLVRDRDRADHHPDGQRGERQQQHQEPGDRSARAEPAQKPPQA
jgi:hypothetical protein